MKTRRNDKQTLWDYDRSRGYVPTTKAAVNGWLAKVKALARPQRRYVLKK